MKRKTPKEKIAELQAAKAKIEAQIQSQKARDRAQERKHDTREKIILGAIVRAHMDHSPAFCEAVYDAIRRFAAANQTTRQAEKINKDIEFLCTRLLPHKPANQP
ncbi:MAG: hypothetical protein AAF862_12745 [Pseudomonadota bacterium]